MKKIAILVFVMMFTFTLSGCGDKKTSSGEKIDYLAEIQDEGGEETEVVAE